MTASEMPRGVPAQELSGKQTTPTDTRRSAHLPRFCSELTSRGRGGGRPKVARPDPARRSGGVPLKLGIPRLRAAPQP